jgi:peptidoglycan hydrolase-like protein with peptidoglycan-binding domain
MRSLLASSLLAVSLLAVPAVAQNNTVHDAQQSLKDKGLYDGPVDGINGPKTRAAVRKYQKQQNIKADGRLGPRTLDTMGVKNSGAKTEFKTSGEQTKTSYSKGGKDIGQGGKDFGKNVAHGHPIEGSKDLGKGVGHGAAAVGVGTAHAAKSAGKGVGNALFSDKHKDTTSTSH